MAMYEWFRTATLIGATLTTGLMAGLYYGFACSVMPGLGQTDDRTFVGAMQWINVKILNGWFALSFAGSLLLTAAAAGLHLRQDGRSALPWIVAALVLYGLTLVTTMGINVPLNNRLDAAGPAGEIADPAAARRGFEAVWVRWNLVRAVVCAAAFCCLIWALVLHGRIAAG
jgi:uncharacterized membrane protein